MEKNIVRQTYAMEKFHDYFKGKKGNEVLGITHTDMDGIMSGSIVADHFGTKNVLMANYGKGDVLGFDYKEASMNEKDVIFTDYSFSTVDNLMALLDQKPKSLSIFDHHMNTLELVSSKKFDAVKNRASQEGIELFYDIDINRCGTKIIFDVLSESNAYSDAVQRLVNLVDTYDRWRFTEADLSSIYLNQYLYGSTQSYVMSPIVADMLHNDNEERLEAWLLIGKKFYDIKIKMNELIASTFSFDTEFHGHKVIAIEARGNSQLLGNAINEYPFVIIFHYDSKKKVFIYSMFKRENSDADILSIAKGYGGGGHVCACGFVSDQRLVTPIR